MATPSFYRNLTGREQPVGYDGSSQGPRVTMEEFANGGSSNRKISDMDARNKEEYVGNKKDQFNVHEHKVIVQLTKPEEKSAGGIVLPESTAKNQAQIATVISAGEDQPHGVGQSILVHEKDGYPFKFLGENYLLYHKDQIIAGIYL